MRRKRQVVYVCSAIKENNLISKIIETENTDDACMLFEKQFSVKPETVFGPFFRKKTFVLEKNTEIKFKAMAETKRGYYNGWLVTALQLESPLDSYYILYDNRIDGNKTYKKPKAMIIKVKELQEI